MRIGAVRIGITVPVALVVIRSRGLCAFAVSTNVPVIRFVSFSSTHAGYIPVWDLYTLFKEIQMVQPKTFITDTQWQRKQHALLLEMAADSKRAGELVAKMDANPDLRQGLWDVYCVAMQTIKDLE